MNKISIALESDGGTWAPLGLFVSDQNPPALCIVNEVLKLIKPLNASRIRFPNTGNGTDVDILIPLGVPVGYLDDKADKYFYFGHSRGDTITVLNSQDLDLCTAVWAVVSYVFASIDQMLPR